MAKSKRLSVGSTVTIPAGTRVTSRGQTTRRDSDSIVTIRNIETTKSGNMKVFWKSNGYRASAILK